MVADTLNTIPGFHCNTVQGAMYAFPKVKNHLAAIADPSIVES
jgi:aspartate/methionine/tyrosine aminotransferase